MKVALVVVLVVALSLVAATAAKRRRGLSADFDEHNRVFRRRFQDDAEFQRRQAKFAANQAKYAQFNQETAEGKHGYTQIDNEFSDMDEDEWKAILIPMDPETERMAADFVPFYSDDRASILDEVDYRQSGCLPAVKNQGSCGSCWAFSAVTPLEFQFCNDTGLKKTFSEQQLTWCVPNGCNGGWYATAWSFLRYSGGILSSDDHPYTSGKSSTRNDAATCPLGINGAAWAQVTGYVNVGSNEEAMKEALALHGPLSAALWVNENFSSYDEGVFDDPDCDDRSQPGRNRVNHGVVIVGYGQSGSAGAYWIVRNSWGPNWGEDGYIRIKRNAGICNIGLAAYPITWVPAG